MRKVILALCMVQAGGLQMLLRNSSSCCPEEEKKTEPPVANPAPVVPVVEPNGDNDDKPGVDDDTPVVNDPNDQPVPKPEMGKEDVLKKLKTLRDANEVLSRRLVANAKIVPKDLAFGFFFLNARSNWNEEKDAESELYNAILRQGDATGEQISKIYTYVDSRTNLLTTISEYVSKHTSVVSAYRNEYRNNFQGQAAQLSQKIGRAWSTATNRVNSVLQTCLTKEQCHRRVQNEFASLSGGSADERAAYMLYWKNYVELSWEVAKQRIFIRPDGLGVMDSLLQFVADTAENLLNNFHVGLFSVRSPAFSSGVAGAAFTGPDIKEMGRAANPLLVGGVPRLSCNYVDRFISILGSADYSNSPEKLIHDRVKRIFDDVQQKAVPGFRSAPMAEFRNNRNIQIYAANEIVTKKEVIRTLLVSYLGLILLHESIDSMYRAATTCSSRETRDVDAIFQKGLVAMKKYVGNPKIESLPGKAATHIEEKKLIRLEQRTIREKIMLMHLDLVNAELSSDIWGETSMADAAEAYRSLNEKLIAAHGSYDART